MHANIYAKTYIHTYISTGRDTSDLMVTVPVGVTIPCHFVDSASPAITPELVRTEIVSSFTSGFSVDHIDTYVAIYVTTVIIILMQTTYAVLNFCHVVSLCL